MDMPVFEIKKERLGPTVNSFRIRAEAYDRILELSAQSNLPVQEIIRRMIDFALLHEKSEGSK